MGDTFHAPLSPTAEQGEAVYVLVNVSLPHLVKIGRTTRSVAERAAELSAPTGVPTPFTVYRTFSVSDSDAAERSVHERLADARVSDNREFFRIDPDVACDIIEHTLTVGADARRTTEDDDALLERATAIAMDDGAVWAGKLAGLLSVEHSRAERLMAALQGRGIIDATGLLINVLAQDRAARIAYREAQRKAAEKAAEQLRKREERARKEADPAYQKRRARLAEKRRIGRERRAIETALEKKHAAQKERMKIALIAAAGLAIVGVAIAATVLAK